MTIDPTPIVDALRVLLEPGQVTELRAIDVSTKAYPRPHTVSGYFDDTATLAAEAARVAPYAMSTYVVLNRIDPALLARANNRIRIMDATEHSTSDANVKRRRYFFVDCDPVRVADVSSSNDEHDAGLARAREIRDMLTGTGWPEPISADSGNGGHLLYRVDLENDEPTKRLFERALKALALRFNDAVVKLDESVFNAARVWKLYGTPARKGDDVSDRPHRLARLLDVPGELTPVGRPLLEALAAMVPDEQSARKMDRAKPGEGIDLARWIHDHNLNVSGPTDWNGGKLWVFPICPWSDDHRNRSAFLIQFANGAIDAGCHHASCARNGWHALRDVFEPGWQTKKDGASRSTLGAVPPTHHETSSAVELLDDWEPPSPFTVSPREPFPVNALPSCLREYVVALATETQTPVDLAALLSLAVVAICAQRKVTVRVRAGWLEPVNVFVVVVLPSGNRKSAVVRALSQPIVEFERRETERLREDFARAHATYKVAEGRAEALRAQASKAQAVDPTSDDARNLLGAAREAAADVARMRIPELPRLLVGDATSEAIAKLLAAQGGRIGSLAAEGTLFDLMRGRYSERPNFDVFLNGHAGDDIRVDRVGRPPEIITHPTLTLGLGVQPDVVRGLVDEKTLRGRGLLARLGYSWPESLVGHREIEPPPVPDDVTQRYHNLIGHLLTIDYAELPPGEEARPHVLYFSPEGYDLFRDFLAWLEPQLAELGDLSTLADWASKLAGLVARIAGLLYVVEFAEDTQRWTRSVSATMVGNAIAIGKYDIAHARRAFAEMGADGKIEDAKFLLAWLARSGETTFTKRDAHRAAQARFKTIDDVEPVLNLLEDHGYIRAQPTDERIGAGRKPSPRYDVNPLITPNSVNSVNSVMGESEPKNEKESVSTDPVGPIPSDRIDTIDRIKDTSPNGHVPSTNGIAFGVGDIAQTKPKDQKALKGHADNSRPSVRCLGCGGRATAENDQLDPNGQALVYCPTCKQAWFAQIPEFPVDEVTEPLSDPHLSTRALGANGTEADDDDAYYAMVDADIRLYGYYRADRPYAQNGGAR